MVVADHVLTPDTQAVLLLCGRFTRVHSGDTQPLGHGEYDRLAAWLVSHDMRPADLMELGWEHRLERNGTPINAARLRALLERGAALAMAVESWTNKGLWVLSRGDAAYPRRLKQRLSRQAPPVLYGAGERDLLEGGGLAIVGSREADEDGLCFTRDVAHTCALQGIQVVSGGARGVDSEAMLAALEAGGTVVGVLADSLARVAVAGKYRRPMQAARLCLVSPYDPESGFNVGNAMSRNKCVHGLAEWSLIVSASLGEGGTWAGATEATNMKRSVFVRLGDAVPAGNGKLLDLGARPFPVEPWHDLAKQLSTGTPAQQISLLPDLSPSVGAEQHTVPDEQAAAVSQDAARATEGLGAVQPDDMPDNGAGQHDGIGKSAFDAVVPLLLAHLCQPRDFGALRELLDVRPGQLQDWLGRAVAEGKVRKTKTKRRELYVANGHEQGTLGE